MEHDQDPRHETSTTHSHPKSQSSNRSYRSHKCDDPFEIFQAVLKEVDLNRVPPLAVQLRQQHEAAAKSDMLSSPQPVTSATLIRKPMWGSYNVLFPIDFNDGQQWLLKLPKVGTRERWTETESRRLVSEYGLHVRLRAQTTLPIPQVYGYDAGFEKIGAPFMLIESIPGKPLFDLWFDRSLPKHALEQKRTTALNDIASNMLKLSAQTYSKCGTLMFDEDGELLNIEPESHPDFQGTWRAACEENIDDPDVRFELGPHASAQQVFASMLEWSRQGFASSWKLMHGSLELLRLFMEWLPCPGPETPFVLTHPDSSLSNILVSDDGHVVSFIDWSEPRSEPSNLGYLEYPAWLTIDWDPYAYQYEEVEEEYPSLRAAGNPEDSPTTLEHYRQVYLDSMIAALQRVSMSVSQVEITRRSLLVRKLYTAAAEGEHLDDILQKVFRACLEIIEQDSQLTYPLTYMDEPQDQAREPASSPKAESITSEKVGVKRVVSGATAPTKATSVSHPDELEPPGIEDLRIAENDMETTHISLQEPSDGVSAAREDTIPSWISHTIREQSLQHPSRSPKPDSIYTVEAILESLNNRPSTPSSYVKGKSSCSSSPPVQLAAWEHRMRSLTEYLGGKDIREQQIQVLKCAFDKLLRTVV